MIRVRDQPRMIRFCPPRILSVACRSRSAGAALDRGVEVVSVSGERGPELVDQDPQSLVERLAEGVLSQVGLHGLPRLLDRDVGVCDAATRLKRVSLGVAVEEVLRSATAAPTTPFRPRAGRAAR